MRKMTSRVLKSLVVVITICTLGAFVPANAYAADVSDMNGHWAREIVQKWIDQGAVKGYEDGTFRPENSITRAEFMSLVNSLFGYNIANDIVFEDVATDAWYADTIGRAAAAGYIAGYPDGTIRPGSLISREETASILMKIMNLVSNEAATSAFKDLAAASWSKGAVGAVYSAGIMTGYPDGSFQAQNNIKRAEALVALDKALRIKSGGLPEADTSLDYVALGDSIAYGSKVAEGLGYVDLFTDKLLSEAGDAQLNALNLGKPGKNSSQLLSDLTTDQATIDAVSGAEVITVSIGGNNLLRPVLTAIETTFGLDSKSATFNNDLAMKLVNKENRDKLKITLAGLSPELEAGVHQFNEDWPEIIRTLKTLAPEAEVTVMTVYNPILEGDAYYGIADKPIQEMNAVINAQSAAFGYKVADVYDAFSHYTGTGALTNFDLSKGSFDVHPTAKGYETIYLCHIS